MNYDSSKQYGKMLRGIAKLISSYDDIYQAALYICKPLEKDRLPFDMRAYFIMSRCAFVELYMNIQYNKDIVAKVIDTFILNPIIDEHIIFNPDLDNSKSFDFVMKDCGDFFSIMQHIKIDINALRMVAHPKEYDEEQVRKAITDVIAPRIESTPENQAAMAYSIATLFGNPEKQDAHQQTEEKQPKYTIVNNELLNDIFYYLKDTDVIPDNASLQRFMDMTENADASKFKFLKNWKFLSALYHVKDCISGDRRAWARDISSSLGKKPKDLSKNNTNNDEWYEKLEKIVAKHTKR